MLESVEGIYQDGHIELLETPKSTRRSRVVVTFLNEKEAQTSTRTSIVGFGEILVDDLEAASREIGRMFAEAAHSREVLFYSCRKGIAFPHIDGHSPKTLS